MAGNGKKNGQQNKDTKQNVSSPYVKFSNEDARDQIIAQLMSFLGINPEQSSFDKIFIKDKDGNQVINKNGDVLYFYNVIFKISTKDGIIHNIKFCQRSNAMIPSSKNANLFDIQLYLSEDKQNIIKQILFSIKKEITILNTVITYSEFKTDKVHGIISFNVKNVNGKKAYEDVQAIICKIRNLLLIKPEEQVLKADLVPTNFPILSKDAKPFQVKVPVVELKVPVVELKAVVNAEVKAPVVEVEAVVNAEVKVPVEENLSEILKKIESGKKIVSKLSKEEEELKNKISNFDEEIKKFELEMKQKLEDGLMEFIKSKEFNITRLESVKIEKQSEISNVEFNTKSLISAISTPLCGNSV